MVRLNPSLRPLYSFLNPKKLLQCCLLAVYTRNPRVYNEKEEIIHEIFVLKWFESAFLLLLQSPCNGGKNGRERGSLKFFQKAPFKWPPCGVFIGVEELLSGSVRIPRGAPGGNLEE